MKGTEKGKKAPGREGQTRGPRGRPWELEGDLYISQAALRTSEFTLNEMGFVQSCNVI